LRHPIVFRFSLAGATLVSVAAIVSAPTEAAAARRFSLAGNVLIEDQDDVFAFPQLATKYARSIGFDYGTASNAGNATLLMGDTYQAWGVTLHRGDAVTPWQLRTDGDKSYLSGYGSTVGTAVQQPDVGAPASPGGGDGVPVPAGDGNGDGGDTSGDGAALPEGLEGGSFGQTASGPKTMIDAIYASANPGNTAWGLRLTLGSDKTFLDPKASGAKESFQSEHFLAATFGYSDYSGDLDWDGAATLLVGMAGVTANGKEAQSASRYELTANFRGTMPLAGEKDTRLGLIGHARYGTATIEPKGAGSNAADDLHLMGGAGPVVKVTDRITVSAYGVLGVMRQTHDPDSKEKGDLDGRLAILFPGFNFATEIQIRDWFFFRSGAEYTYQFRIQDYGTPPAGFEASDRQDSFVWNTGVGFVFGDLHLDGALSHQFITEGPDFIGGDSPLFGMVSASAKF
jgi:hypothetical protein